MGLACHALRKMTQKISPHDSGFLFKVLTMAPLASFQTMWWHHIVWRSHSSHDNIWTIWVHVVMTSCNYVISTMWWCHVMTSPAMWWHHHSHVMTSFEPWQHLNHFNTCCDDITRAMWWHHFSHDNWAIWLHFMLYYVNHSTTWPLVRECKLTHICWRIYACVNGEVD